MKRKILTILICGIMVLGITGCEIPKGKTVNPVYADAQSTVAILVDAIERKDAQAIKDSKGVYMHGVDDDPDILLWDYTK